MIRSGDRVRCIVDCYEQGSPRYGDQFIAGEMTNADEVHHPASCRMWPQSNFALVTPPTLSEVGMLYSVHDLSFSQIQLVMAALKGTPMPVISFKQKGKR